MVCVPSPLERCHLRVTTMYRNVSSQAWRSRNRVGNLCLKMSTFWLSYIPFFPINNECYGTKTFSALVWWMFEWFSPGRKNTSLQRNDRLSHGLPEDTGWLLPSPYSSNTVSVFLYTCIWMCACTEMHVFSPVRTIKYYVFVSQSMPWEIHNAVAGDELETT